MPGPAAATLDRRVQFRRRATTGTTFGEYVDLGAPVWGNFRQLAESDEALGSLRYTSKVGVLTIRDSAFARSIDPADRAVIDGEEYELRAVSLPDRASGTIRIDVKSGPSRAAYLDMVNRRGETVTIRRPGTPPVDALVRVRIIGFDERGSLAPDQLVDLIQQGYRLAIVLAEDLESQGWPLPPRRGDRIIRDGKQMPVEAVDADTHRSAGAVIAYVLTLSGA
jgi:hypothetical protein